MTTQTPTGSEGLVVVYQLNEPIRAELLKSMLADSGIDCFIANGNQASFAGIDVIPVELLVASDDAERAIELIKAHENINDM